jgi:autotransporter-associated beta strand protein
LVPERGIYQFSTFNSDGVRLHINGLLVIDDFKDQAAKWKESPSFRLNAGQMLELQMEFYKNTGSAVAKLKWKGPSFAGANGVIIDKEWLFDGAGVYRRPYAHEQSVTLVQSMPQAIILQGRGVISRPLTYAVLTPPAHGTLTGIAPNLTYTPARQYKGSDSFTFRVNNGFTNSAPATVSIGILAGLPFSHTWLNATSGKASVTGNWTSGAAPAPTGQPYYTLNFTPAGTYTVTHDLKNGFQLNQLNVASALTLAGTNSLAFTANGFILPQFNQNSASDVTISAPMRLSAMTTLGGLGGSVNLAGVISGPGGLIKNSAGTLLINTAANTYSGGTIINSGQLTLGIQADGALGTGPVTLNGATLFMARVNATNALIVNSGKIFSDNGYGNTWSGPVTLNGNLVIEGPRYAGFSMTGVISGAGGLTLRGANPVTLTRANSYTGPTSIYAGTLSCHTVSALGCGALSIGSRAKLALHYTGNTDITALTLGGVLQPAGTYGSTASPATCKNDIYFSGTGTVTSGMKNTKRAK